ncbi:hypothetical protein [Pedobacter nototheniae]|uniref:hypothetical protein n=1 Tax=Pedobacter nototheniae TaxID=2488994 RepID=UPI00103D88B4|nr:hypothetical protein [Pedobacter nototheniae]
MPITNLNNTHLTLDAVTAAKDALTKLEDSLSLITTNLVAEERQKYGSINEQNKLLVNKVQDYQQSQPQLGTTQVDWAEFARDYSSRLLMESLIARLESITIRLHNAKTLHDYDNYQAALVDYGYTNFMAGTGADAYEIKFNDLKQFFGRTKPAQTSTNL